ncbi:homoserine dehydrogenase [Bernardetia litoralis DSM 6794]|uniref:Homoserine dehydrogenase n=1 Tax=Bernardetia litoralis (strain ATCC 23117 / DSM 6794 / NBRC 15988 / NCIMB 1366 / Fx l1 / Sio-4) TaxID=880071 RepID=I4AP80_BERLS|nr:homoserine dehydrogenase [Bernardetia litoralis]AFM05765.1 homoserine dehydrogenase [Bernardetia litoralis DSM 6794]
MKKTVKIGLFGFGCVGQGLYDILQNNTENTGFEAQILKICVKNKEKKREIDASYFTFDKDEILNNSEINLVVELISDAEEAYQIVKKALLSGKNVVTANKKMLALHLEELVRIQKETGTSLLYEAAVCGSIPIIRTLAEYYDNEFLYSVSGIFNGSSNYILSKISNENLSYDVALKQAQKLGFAEADPTLDVAGFDATYKLCLLATQAYGIFINPDEVLRIGINNLKKEDIDFAKNYSVKKENDQNTTNFKVKLVASISRIKSSENNQVLLYVLPVFVDAENPLYNVENENNAVLVEAAFSDKQTFIGKGAGGHPTGSAVLSDISALRFDYQYEYRKTDRNKEKNALGQTLISPTQNVEAEVYLRFENHLSKKELLQNIDFTEILTENENHIIGKIILSELFEKRDFIEKHHIFVALCGEVKAVN